MNVDIERMSDHAINIAEAGEDLIKKDLSFSVDAYDELHELADIVFNSLDLINKIIDTGNSDLFILIKRNEDKIDNLCYRYRDIEIERMRNNKDEAESGIIYSELLIDIERIGDHIMNVAENLCLDYGGH